MREKKPDNNKVYALKRKATKKLDADVHASTYHLLIDLAYFAINR